MRQDALVKQVAAEIGGAPVMAQMLARRLIAIIGPAVLERAAAEIDRRTLSGGLEARILRAMAKEMT